MTNLGHQINQIICGDCLEVMKGFPDESIDLIATDPPYGYSFMGKDWDNAVPSVEIWKECLHVLKSGAFAFIMSSPRQDVLSQMIVRLGQAGFDMGFTSIYWAYASGFPKAMNISKTVDKRLGVAREVIGKLERNDRELDNVEAGFFKQDEFGGRRKTQLNVTEATSEEAKVLDGSYGGFQPKPAIEVIIVAMKPLSEKTFVDQALRNGKGVSWLDDARIPFSDKTPEQFARNFDDSKRTEPKFSGKYNNGKIGDYRERVPNLQEGRFPANLLVSDDVLNDGKEHETHEGTYVSSKATSIFGIGEGSYNTDRKLSEGNSGSFSRYFDLDKWFDKTIIQLSESVRKTFPFLICPKASKNERNQGLENLEAKMKDPENRSIEDNGGLQDRIHGKVLKKNFHPTVKPLKLMSYLVTLGSRPNDVVLDPFVGSGTTCLAAEILNRKWIGIDNNPEYCEIARKRIGHLPEKLESFG